MNSRGVACSVPVVGMLAGALGTAAGRHLPSLQTLAEALAVAMVLLSVLAWLVVDAGERDQRLTPVLVLGVLLAPALALPYYFNQTRERQARAAANALALVLAVTTLAGYWLGGGMAAGAT